MLEAAEVTSLLGDSEPLPKPVAFQDSQHVIDPPQRKAAIADRSQLIESPFGRTKVSASFWTIKYVGLPMACCRRQEMERSSSGVRLDESSGTTIATSPPSVMGRGFGRPDETIRNVQVRLFGGTGIFPAHAIPLEAASRR
jgi:hypothetical protein